MRLETLLRALRKCERIDGWYEGSYDLSIGDLRLMPGPESKTERLADKIERRVVEMFEGEYREGYKTAQAFTIEEYEK